MLIYNAMRVAAILHNRLLIFDGYDKFDGESCDTDEDEPENPVAPSPEVPDDFDATEGAVAAGEAAPGVLTQHPLGSQENPIPFSQGNYWPLKHALMKHLSYAYTQGKLSWPKHFSKVQKLDMPLLTRALARADHFSRSHFRIAPSILRRRHLTSGQYTEGIGNGLFALKKFKPGDHLLNFVGDTITNQQYITRTEAGRGGYILANSLATYFLDCFDHARNGTCWASMANSPYGCRVPGSTSMVTANAQLVVFAHGNHNYTWSIKAIKPIERGQEVLMNYGARYQYPSHYGPALL